MFKKNKNKLTNYILIFFLQNNRLGKFFCGWVFIIFKTMKIWAIVLLSGLGVLLLAIAIYVRKTYLKEKKEYVQLMGGYLYWSCKPHHNGLIPQYETFKSIVDFNVIDFATITLDPWSFVNQGGYREKFRMIGNKEFLHEVGEKLDQLHTAEQEKVDAAVMENKPPPTLPPTLMHSPNRPEAFALRFELIAELQKQIMLGKQGMHTNRSTSYKFVTDPAFIIEREMSKLNGSCIVS